MSEQNKSNIAYSPAAMKAFRENMPNIPALDFRPLPRSYKSDWRVLHCDGFEEKKLLWFRYVPYYPLCDFCGQRRNESHNLVTCYRAMCAAVDMHQMFGRPYMPGVPPAAIQTFGARAEVLARIQGAYLSEQDRKEPYAF